jgi:hypothetical protein
LDILLNLSLDELPNLLLDVARFGVWSLRCNNARVTTNTEVGWMEILNSEPLMRCQFEIQRMGRSQLISGSVLAVHATSISINQKSFFWRASQVLVRLLRQLSTQGEQKFFLNARFATSLDKIGVPTEQQSLMLAWKQIKKLFEIKIWRRWLPNRWALMSGKSGEADLFDWGSVGSKVPPKGVNWADPFILIRQHESHLFFEEYLYKTKIGHISHAMIDGNGYISDPRVVLVRPYHLSYPFIFEHRGEYYMIPETAQNRAIESYRCTRFPDQWEFHKTLMPDVLAVDTTLIEYALRWWMFVNIAAKGGSTLDELHLFYADDPLSDNWTPHLMNPIISDVRRARPAGRIFRREGGLVRPSQDSSLRYGYAINFNRITKLTINEYEEELIERIEPPNDNILAVHTYNRTDDLCVIDTLLRR